MLVAGFTGVLDMLAGVEEALAFFAFDRRSTPAPPHHAADRPAGPRCGVFGDQLLNRFGLELDAGVLRLFSMPRDEAAGDAQQIGRFHQLNGAASNRRPFFVGPAAPAPRFPSG